MTGPDLPPQFRLIARDSVGSTNDEARLLAEAGAAADFLVISAREQSAGRGRRGRSWVSPPGNLHCSLLLAAPRLDQAAQLGFVAAVALVDALAALVPGAAFRCKWPNDVLANGRKVAGMLLEPSGFARETSGLPAKPAGSGWLVLGLGVDVAFAPPDDAVLHPAISLAGLGYGGDAPAVLAAFCHAFAPWVARWRGQGFAPVRQAFLDRAHGLGSPMVVRLQTGDQTGTFAGLDGDGALLLDHEGGRTRIMAGDVHFPA